jgi:hypothetical protein
MFKGQYAMKLMFDRCAATCESLVAANDPWSSLECAKATPLSAVSTR